MIRFSRAKESERQNVSKDITQLYLELSSYCNLSCITCIRNSVVHFKPTHLSPYLMGRIITSIKEIKTFWKNRNGRRLFEYFCRPAEEGLRWAWLWMSLRKMILPSRTAASRLRLKGICLKKRNPFVLILSSPSEDRVSSSPRICRRVAVAETRALVETSSKENGG